MGPVERMVRPHCLPVLVSHEAQPMRPKCCFPTCAASRTAPREPFAALGEETDSRPVGFADLHDESGYPLQADFELL